MDSNKKILVVGDLHGFFSVLQEVILCTEGIALVLQCGDFGYWPDDMRLPRRGFRNAFGQIIPVHFCDGNHEHHEALAELPLSAHGSCAIVPGVFYQARGSVLRLPNGKSVLFAGGASSVDRASRVARVDWFEQEVLTEQDYARFPEKAQIDLVISHAAPSSMQVPSGPVVDFSDPSRDILEKILHGYRPRQWFCGHYHQRFSQQLGKCAFTALDCAHSPYDVNEVQEAGFEVLVV